MYYNLQPSTVYYWRVGAYYDGDRTDTNWSLQHSCYHWGTRQRPITWAVAGLSGKWPGGVTTPDLTLSWQPVHGALEYSVWLTIIITRFDGV